VAYKFEQTRGFKTPANSAGRGPTKPVLAYLPKMRGA